MVKSNVPGFYNLARFFGANYAVTDELVCYRVFVPVGTAHRQLLATLLNLPTKLPVWYTEDAALRDDLAAMYQLAYEATTQAWLEGGIGCMDCAKIIECITDDPDVRAALSAWFVDASKNDPDVISAINAYNNYPSSTPRGEPLSETRMGEDISTAYNPTCDLNILWSQCLGLVEETNAAIIDVLEKFEVFNNGAELLNSIISSIPLVSAAEVASGIDGIFELFNYYQEAFNEQYLAQYTTTFGGTRDQIACALFCACRDDCVITIDRVLTVLQERIEAYITIPPLELLADLITFAAGIDQDDSFVVDLAFWFGWKTLAVANYFFGGIASDVLPIVCELYADTPSSDWELLCTDCPSCAEPTWRIVNPLGTDGGTYDQTDNMDGTWTIVFTSAFSSGANRIAIVEANGCCWLVTSVTYSATPENLNNYYACGANPTDEDYGNGSVVGSVPVDECSAGVLGSSVSTAFTVTLVVEACP